MDFSKLEDKLLTNEESITFDEAMELTNTPKDKILELTTLARRVTLKYKGDGVFLRSIISAKTGDCSEDCSFCSQSVHYSSPISKHPFLDPEEVLQAALQSEKMGAFDFCIVIAVKGPNKRQFKKVLESIELVKKHTKLEIGCSLGSLTKEQAQGLAQAGVWKHVVITFLIFVLPIHIKKELTLQCLRRKQVWNYVAAELLEWVKL